MMSDFRGDGGSEMTPKNRTLEGKNRTLGGRGGQKSSKIVGHHLCTFPNNISTDSGCGNSQDHGHTSLAKDF